ncbi:hypothetical protein [Flagellimonas allohymeniacidonis]|nr:hypothetical protein [Allomuricauda hymeniacidonis]
MEEKEVYRGFWQQLGCVLSLIAILGILFLIGLGIYFFLTGA